MTEKLTMRDFTMLMGILRGCYPQRMTDNEWEITVRRYWQDLQRFDKRAVAKACDKAWKIYAKWFPTLGEMVDLCETMEKQYLEYVPYSKQLEEGSYTDPEEAKRQIANIIDSLTANTKLEE